MKRLRPHFSFANVTSLVALFVALGGTSYAAVKLKKGSVTSREIKDASLQAEDLAPSAKFSGPRGPRGDQGPAGPAGGKGDQGDKGDRGPSNVRIIGKPVVPLSRNARELTTVLEMRNVEAGQYLITFTGEAGLRVANRGMYVVCELSANGTVVSYTAGIVGDAYGADAGLSDQVTVDRPSAFDLKLACYPDQSTVGEPAGPYLDHAKVSALKVGSITIG